MIHRTLTLTVQFLAALFLMGFLHVPSAMACRDCPFPMKIDENRWLMPDQKLVVQIDEKPFDPDWVISTVSLKDASTNNVVATGTAFRRTATMNYVAYLVDKSDNVIVGEIHWHDIEQGSIQARFTCVGHCVLEEYF